jgi:GT2 family glycosyltransferase
LDKTKNDIMLLNSDTKVTEGFLEEMAEVLYAEEKIGAVSPRSNNATLATVPLSAAPDKGIEAKDSFDIFLKLRSKLPRYTEVPTVHGFCMLTRRSLIKELGLFDEIYGRGYGEENDYCMRIRKNGYKSVLANRAYVFHMEARSFTFGKKEELLAINRKILDERYPDYTQLIRNYMKSEVEIENHIESELGIKKYKHNTLKKIKRKLKYLTS